MIPKLKLFIFPRLQGEVSGIINIIETLTAGILVITSFSASIAGLFTL